MSRHRPHRIAFAVVGLALSGAAAAVPARADTGPVFVVPSRPGVPIAINGRDASWSVVEGDVGLARPGHLVPVIVGGGRPLPPRRSYERNHYYPRYGVAPQRGRHEIEPSPGEPMPEPAEGFSRSWSTNSWSTSSEPQVQYSEQHGEKPRPQSYRSEGDHLPPTVEHGQPFTPPIVVVPYGGRGHRR